MCVPGCMEKISKKLGRRQFLGSMIAASAYAAAGCTQNKAIELASASSDKAGIKQRTQTTFTEVVDLTHTLSTDFPNFFGKPMFKLKSNTTLKKDHFNTNYIEVFEHVGTHIDAPIHFSADGRTVDEIPVSDLVLPLHIIDIKLKADKDHDAEVTVEDIMEYESKHGQIKEASCVAMNSGWDKRATSNDFRNLDSKKVMHFPGFSLDASKFLAEKRNAYSIASDTLSLDRGNSKDFATHYHWLPSGRFGIECLANLDQLPAVGATIVVGAPKFKGGTGGPSRIIALK